MYKLLNPSENAIAHLEHKQSNTHFYVVGQIRDNTYKGYAVLPKCCFPIIIDSIESSDLSKGNWLGRRPMTPDTNFTKKSWEAVKSAHFPRNFARW